MDNRRIVTPQTKEEKQGMKIRKATSVNKAKKWAVYKKVGVAIIDLFIVVGPDGKVRGMAPPERKRCADVMHGDFFNKDGSILAMSSYAKMKMPIVDLRPDDATAIKWPGVPEEGPGETPVFGDDMDPDPDLVTPPIAKDDKNWMDDPELNPHTKNYDDLIDLPKKAPSDTEVDEYFSKPKPDPSALPENGVIGSDDMAGPNPLIAQLINNGYSEAEAIAIANKKPIEAPRPGIDVKVNLDHDPGYTESHDPDKKPDIVLVDNVGFKMKHYIWLNKRAKETGLTFQRCIDQIVAHHFASDPTRHSMITKSGGFSGKREDVKDIVKKL